MKARIKIGEQEVMMEANAYTPVIYRECFPGRDIFRELIQIEELEEKMQNYYEEESWNGIPVIGYNYIDAATVNAL